MRFAASAGDGSAGELPPITDDDEESASGHAPVAEEIEEAA